MRDPNCEFRYFRDDKGCCDNCGARLPKYRRNWCSDECGREYFVNHNIAGARPLVWLASDGACVLCGVICLAPYRTERQHPDWPHALPGEHWMDHERRVKEFQRAHRDEYGEVDHIVPCEDYNAGCQHHLDNLRLLCHGCHVRITTVNRRRTSAIPRLRAG